MCTGINVVCSSVLLLFHQYSLIGLITWRTPLEIPKTGALPLESGRMFTCNERRKHLRNIDYSELHVCTIRLVILQCVWSVRKVDSFYC